MKDGTRLLTLCLLTVMLLGASPGVARAQTPVPQSLPEATAVLERTPPSPSPTPATSAEATPEGTQAVVVEGATTQDAGQESEPEPAAPGLLADIVQTRTPIPTGTPGPIVSGVEQLTSEVGLAWTVFLGLRAADWINLGISLLLVLVGYLLGTWLVRRLLPRLALYTSNEFDDAFVRQSGPALRWLVVLFILRLATQRLVFIRPAVWTVLLDIYFVSSLFLVFHILWQSIDLAVKMYTERTAETGRWGELAPIITLLVRAGRGMLILVGGTVLLSHFGINVAALTTAMGLGGLAFSLAARDTIADAISGIIILIDQPFRIGDRIEIQRVGTWGDVIDIGMRTTRIRTMDNRLVIVPNSVISANQVVNYTYPDPQYRIETHVGIAYGTDVETARRVIVEAVQHVEGVLLDRPVDALYNEMGDAAMIFRVRWWIESYVDTRRVIDRIHTALQHALDEAGIISPFPTQNINLRVPGPRLKADLAEGGSDTGAPQPSYDGPSPWHLVGRQDTSE